MTPFVIDASLQADCELIQILRHISNCQLCRARLTESEAAVSLHMLEQKEKQAKEVMP